MNTFETTAIVGDDGQVRVSGVPFESGTPVEVSIVPTPRGGPAADAEGSDSVGRLFAALDKARNTESVGPFRREKLYIVSDFSVGIPL